MKLVNDIRILQYHQQQNDSSNTVAEEFFLLTHGRSGITILPEAPSFE
jgi:hypothetical protein